MDFFTYIHAVGTGVKSNRDLTFQEAQDMMRQILNQDVPPEQIAAFLLGWRLKPESVEEFSGALSVFDEFMKKTTLQNSIELGYPFDGKVKNPYLFPHVATFLQKQNLNLVVSGDERQPAKYGITTKEVATSVKLSPNLHFFDRKDFFKQLSDLTQIRKNLGLRTALNTIEKLPHVAQSEYGIVGVFHKPYVKKYIELFAKRYKRFALIQGNEGTPELFSRSRLWIYEAGDLQEYKIDPQKYGVEYKKSLEKISLEESLKLMKNPSDEYLKLAKLNAAICMFLAEKIVSIDEAYYDILS